VESSFKLPKFDKEKYLKKERRNIKITFISFLFGIVMAIVCFGFWALMGSEQGSRWILVLFVGLIDAIFIRYIVQRLGIDLTDFTNKNWLGSYAIYFFSWLIFFIVLVNPPFYDDEAPMIEHIVLPGMQETGGTVGIIAKITDNVGVEKNKIQLQITDPDDNTSIISPDGFEYEDVIVKYIYNNPDNLLGEFKYKLSAEDVSGLTTIKTGSFYYDNDAIDITSSRFVNITAGDDITIEVDELVSTQNFRVYYKLNDGEEINVNRKYSEVKEEYETNPEFEGWEENSKFNLSVFAEASYYFRGIPTKYSNTVKDTENYVFTTGSGSRIGSEDRLIEYNCTLASLNKGQPSNTINYKLPCPSQIRVPGFEAVIFLLSLIVVAIIIRYNKKKKSNKK